VKSGARVFIVQRDVVALEIKPAEGTLAVGAHVQLTLFARNAKGATALIPANMAVWSSSNDGVAEVTRQGRINARKPGGVTITARYADKSVQVTFMIAGG
jgi:hypothetical protein